MAEQSSNCIPDGRVQFPSLPNLLLEPSNNYVMQNIRSQIDPRIKQARWLLQQSRVEEARALYEDVCSDNSRDAESFYVLGTIYGHIGDFSESVRNMLKCLNILPDAFMARCALGMAYKELGQYAEASNAFRIALKQQPCNIDLLLEYSNTLLKENKINEAEASLRRILQLKPDCSNAIHGLGAVHQRNNNFVEAARLYKLALQIDPDNSVTHYNLGYMLHVLGSPDKAIQHYTAAVKLNPGYAEAFKLLGDALTGQSRTEEALAAYDAAVQHKPDYLDALIGKIMLHERMNDISEAFRLLGPLIDEKIPHPGVGLAFAQLCRHFNRCDEAISYLKALLNASLPELVESQIHFALGKLLDSYMRYQQAFHHYQKGNSLKKVIYDPERQEKKFEKLADVFSRGYMQNSPKSSNTSDLPVFIVGMPRSGTTLVESILASHPAVYGAGELLNIMRQVEAISISKSISEGFPYCIKSLTAQKLRDLSDEYLDYIRALAPNAKRITDKMPHNFVHLGLISMEFPNARVIHCLRDPRDTCLSIYFQSFSDSHPYASNLEHIAHYYRQYLRLMRHWHDVLDIHILEVRYEDIIKDQEKISRQMIGFIGLEWDSDCLRFDKLPRAVDTISYDQVRKPIYSESVSRWKHYEQDLQPLLTALDGMIWQ